MSRRTKTLLLGMDGATFTLLKPLMAAGHMPFLKKVVDEGVHSVLMSTPYPVTPQAWTSIATGVNPGEHGIFDFISADDSSGRVMFHLESARAIRAETIWSMLSRQGKAAASLNFPVSYLTPPFNGYMVPGFVTARVLKMGVMPREFWKTVKALPGFELDAISWNSEGGETTLGGYRMREYDAIKAWVDRLKAKENGWYAIANEILDRNDTDLLCVVFEGVDRIQHLMWDLLDERYFPKDATEAEIKGRAYCLSYYTHVDNYLRQLVEKAGPEAQVFFCSDHGFGDTTELVYINEWLVREGYMAWKSNAAHDKASMMFAPNMRDHYDSIDFEKTVAYARSASCNGIYIRVAKAPGQQGIPPEKYPLLREEIRQKLLAWKDPKTGTPVIRSITTKEEVYQGRSMAHAPDLTLHLRDGGFISILPSDEVVKPRPEVKGTHRPEGVFFAYGPGIRRGAELAPRQIVDMVPTMLHSLGMPIPEDLPGQVIAEAFEPEYLAKNPVRKGPATVVPDDDGRSSEAKLAEADQNVVLERLKALGYIE